MCLETIKDAALDRESVEDIVRSLDRALEAGRYKVIYDSRTGSKPWNGVEKLKRFCDANQTEVENKKSE